MYEEHYGLKTDPFRLSPDHHFCLRHATFEKAKAYMQYAVHRAEGFVMITGRPGTGKSTLIEDVLQELEGKEIITAKLVTAQLGAQDLLQMTAFNFGIPTKEKSKSFLIMEMQGFFADCIADGKRPLLVIDEAQGLSLEAMEELRLLTNLRMNDMPMLQIFLVGQEELRDRVMDRRMEQLHQRLIATCHLEPLDFKQTAAYVMHRLKVAGWQGRPKLRASIFRPLYRFSQGIPRRINLFMGRLLMHGWLEDKDELAEAEAKVILDELEQEHLAPLRPGQTLKSSDLQMDIDDIEEELRIPAQKIGGKLMTQSASERLAVDIPAAPPKSVRRSPKTSSSVTPINAHRNNKQTDGHPPVAANKSKVANDLDDTETSKKATSAEAQDSKRRPEPHTEAQSPPDATPSSRKELMQNLAGMGLSLLVAGILCLLVLLCGPIPSGSTQLLSGSSSIAALRGKLYQLSDGALPLFFQPTETTEVSNAPNEAADEQPLATNDSSAE